MTRIILLIIILLALLLFLPAEPISAPKRAQPQDSKPIYPQIEAGAALAQNLLTGEILFSKNSKEVLPLASITKVITLLVVLDKLDLDKEIEISLDAILTPEPSSLRVGEHFLVKDLVAMAMAESSNDAITALYEYVAGKNQIIEEKQKEWFLDLMRKKAEQLGATDMKFYNIWGLDESPELAGGYGSAGDLLKIAKASLGSPLWQLGAVNEIVSKESIKHNFKFTNELGPELSPLLGSKTGFTDLAGGNLLIVVEYPIGHPLGIVVLGSSEQGRFDDVKKILEWVKMR